MIPSFVGQKVVAKTRASILFEPFSDLIKDRRILELAPYDGWFTREFFNLGAKKVTAVEANPEAVATIYLNLQKEVRAERLEVREADLHLDLYNLTPGCFDTVICTGFLYHTPHVFWILEGIARLQAQSILIESFHESQLVLKPEPINQPGCRQTNHRGLPFYLGVSSEDIIQWMDLLGYAVHKRIDKSKEQLPSNEEISDSQKAYFDLRLYQYAIWFERKTNHSIVECG